MSSGVKIDPQTVETYNSLKLGRKFRCIFYQMSADNTQICVEKTLEPTSSFEDMVAALPQSDSRYVVFDYEYQEEGATKNKIVFVNWCPDTAPIKKKMLYTSSKDSIRKALVGIQVEIQATDLSECSKEVFDEKCKK
ncbi:hypothetical protein CYY_007755 [Polysphondylium violaceum]|uniref:ADF-H domain-containing protein n=1 Tax=Polysphondylium violaceum TaxID=133409 RepID=A0A8J4PWR9_9MYCE|nr:hypothetical protein CYY_007755 [Polysphondylium violaceum]